MRDLRRDVDGLASREPRRMTVDDHLELAFQNVDRLRHAMVHVCGQLPTRWWVVDKQTQRTVRLVGAEVDLGSHSSGHPNGARRGNHRLTIPPHPLCEVAREAGAHIVARLQRRQRARRSPVDEVTNAIAAWIPVRS